MIDLKEPLSRVLAGGDPLTTVRRNASQTVASTFQPLRADQFGGDVYTRSNINLKSVSTPVGYQAVASGNRSTAVGSFANAREDSAVALGVYALAFGLSSVAIGDQAKANGRQAIAIGTLAQGNNLATITIGPGASVAAPFGIAIGQNAKMLGEATGSVAIGAGAWASEQSVAIGYQADTSVGGGLSIWGQAYGYQAATRFNGEVVFGSAAAPVALWGFTAGHGGYFDIQCTDTNFTIDAAAFTDSSTILPAGSLVIAASVRVLTVIPTAATFDVGVAGATTRYATGVSTAAGTADAGTDDSIRPYAAATAIRITPNLVPAAGTGAVRVIAYYIVITPPTS